MAEFLVPRKLVLEATTFLRAAGREHAEGRVLWVGRFSKSNRFHLTRSIIPRQTVTAVETTVDGDELLKIARDCHAREEILAIQLHSHPGPAYHSNVDNELAITTEIGSLSIVVPSFSKHHRDRLDGCAFFRLMGDGWCGPMPASRVESLFRIEEEPPR